MQFRLVIAWACYLVSVPVWWLGNIVLRGFYLKLVGWADYWQGTNRLQRWQEMRDGEAKFRRSCVGVNQDQ